MGLFPTPVINGNKFSFSSIDLRPMGQRITDFKEVEYSTELDPGVMYGTSAAPVGRSRGLQKTEASITLYREAWLAFQASLILLSTTSNLNPLGNPAGWMEVSWDAMISYAETPVSPVQKDVLKGARIKKWTANHSESNEILTVKLDLHVMQIILNGSAPLNVVVF